MQKLKTAISIALVVAASACSKSSNKAGDSALNTDLSLAAQQKTSLDSISAVERAQDSALAAPALASKPVTPAPVTHTASTAHHTVHHSSGSSRSESSGEVVAAPVTHTTTVKHTQRDAAIGAAAGAVLGATTSRNKVKGGVIGAAVGGILGGVLGNNVDKTKKTTP
ncbi:MAG TPA: YMGG-like glycine zipper-containing protein [Gemmatimonadaceae bacterium]|jgi:hypothetical protein